jgi:voltage-gated potassium channel
MIAILKDKIQSIDVFSEKTLDLFIQSMILLSLISFSIETLPSITDHTRHLLNDFEIFSVGVFTLEYFVRIFYAENKVKFIFHFLVSSTCWLFSPFISPQAWI